MIEHIESSDIDDIIIACMIVASLGTMLVGKIFETKRRHWRRDPPHWNSNDEKDKS